MKLGTLNKGYGMSLQVAHVPGTNSCWRPAAVSGIRRSCAARVQWLQTHMAVSINGGPFLWVYLKKRRCILGSILVACFWETPLSGQCSTAEGRSCHEE